ncbi:hypothetical protein LET1_00038 [Pectobacterium phage LET1]|nr:hypothetical protein LET1_00038 [Pectobacterium phage LET1]
MYIRKAFLSDVNTFLPSPDDIREFRAHNHRRDLRETLRLHLTESSVVLQHGTKVLAYGGNQGDCVWFLTEHNSLFLSHPEKLQFISCISEYRDLMLDQYGTIWNYVWSGNKSHIRFLKVLGAKFHDEWTTSPVTGERFQLFTISKEDVCVNP